MPGFAADGELSVLELPSLPGRWDIEDFAVFGDSASSQFDALLLELDDDFVVVEGVEPVFGADDALEFFLDGVPAHVFALGVGGAAGEESAERKDAARGLNPLFTHRARNGRHVNSQLIGHQN